MEMATASVNQASSSGSGPRFFARWAKSHRTAGARRPVDGLDDALILQAFSGCMRLLIALDTRCHVVPLSSELIGGSILGSSITSCPSINRLTRRCRLATRADRVAIHGVQFRPSQGALPTKELRAVIAVAASGCSGKPPGEAQHEMPCLFDLAKTRISRGRVDTSDHLTGLFIR